MSRVWFTGELETVATFWRVLRTDGVTLGFTSHDRDLWFDGVLHRASPGMVPSSIKRTSDFEPDSAEVSGALSHDAITATDLAEGRFDGAQVRMGLVDWETMEHATVYGGTIGGAVEEDGRFSADLVSRKAELLRDPVPRTSPNCRAEFCGPGCALDPAFFTHETQVASVDPDANAVTLTGGPALADLIGGWLRWVDGPRAGARMGVVAAGGGALVLDRPLSEAIGPGTPVMVREGCDRTLTTCADRFANAVNFQGEPFLPGNDMLSRYAVPAQ